jgi:hypothetical protein
MALRGLQRISHRRFVEQRRASSLDQRIERLQRLLRLGRCIALSLDASLTIARI